MVTLSEIKSNTGYDYSLDKKGALIVKGSNKKPLKPADYERIHSLTAKALGVEDLDAEILSLLNYKTDTIAANAADSYGADYLDKQVSEKFVITEPSSNVGWKIGQYPSGAARVGKIKQSVTIKEQQALSTLPVDQRKDAQCLFEKLYALESYSPFSNDVLFRDTDDEDFFLNVYRPSVYMEIARGYWIDRETKKPVRASYTMPAVDGFEELPDVIQAFLTHFFPDADDRKWFIQWLAWSVFEQCEVIPMLLGAEGTGKGMLNGLWAEMLGSKNWAPMNASSLSGQFAMANFLDKRGVSINEGVIDTSEQWENLKNSTDSVIKVNDKHEKAKSVLKTHSSMYTANHFDGAKGIDIKKARRLAILAITNEPLQGAEVTLRNGKVFKFTEEQINRLIPSKNSVDGVHAETMGLFAYLHSLYVNGVLDASVKNTARKNVAQTQLVAECSASQWVQEIAYAVIPNLVSRKLDSVSSRKTKAGELSDVEFYVNAKKPDFPVKVLLSAIKDDYEGSDKKTLSVGIPKIKEGLSNLGNANGNFATIKPDGRSSEAVLLSWKYLAEIKKSLNYEQRTKLAEMAVNDPAHDSYVFIATKPNIDNPFN